MKKLLFTLIIMVGLSMPTYAMGLFYTNATVPVTATGNILKDSSCLKKGESSATSILFLVELGDAGINTAARNAGITKIDFVDVNEKSVFIFFRKITTKVYGE